MEEDMLKKHLAAGLATMALMTTSALAQTSTAPAQPATPAPQTTTQSSTMSSSGSGQIMTHMAANMMRGSKLMGVDVYGADNQKIGDIKELLVDRDGSVDAIVVGIGGFLGIGEKDIAIPFKSVQWIDEPARTASTTTSPATTGGVSSPTPPSANQPATTGSTATTTTRTGNDGVPDRAVVQMTKAELQNAPEFRYSMNDASRTTTTTSPPASTTRPGTAPQQ
jgi:sporulation protein YlmC with PRC-barrel domain